MKELLYYIVKALVDHPRRFPLTKLNGGELVLELTVDPSDMGKVIGRQEELPRPFAHWSKRPLFARIFAFPWIFSGKPAKSR